MNILQIITGGIAAYKAVNLTSQLIKSGHHVRVVMSESATQFITPLTLQTISKNRVYTDLFDERNEKEIQHIDLVKWADKIIIAPATANTIAKMANGLATDLISSLLLANTDFNKVYIAPAMNTKMYENPLTQANIQKLVQLGVQFIEPTEGILACGDIGKGKFPEVEQIQAAVFEKQHLQGKKVIVTAGATKEYIDPVRYLSNPSSGKMGIALAMEAANQGAQVVLITGATNLPIHKNITIEKIVSAQEMFEAVKQNSQKADIIIKAAAVSDYTPAEVFDKKMKKQEGEMTLILKRTVDILQYLGKHKQEGQILVGFAAETNDVLAYALDKLERKNLDFIVANDVSRQDIGFESNTNEVLVIDKNKHVTTIPKNTKENIAKSIIEQISHSYTPKTESM